MAEIPTVEFDRSNVTEGVKAHVRTQIISLEGVDRSHFEKIYDAALRSILAGRDLRVLYIALIEMNVIGMTKRRAEEITLFLNNTASALMIKEHQVALGIIQAQWLHSGAPCEVNPKKPTGLDAEHRAANGQLFEVSAGMFLNGKQTWPGLEAGCKCVSKSIIP